MTALNWKILSIIWFYAACILNSYKCNHVKKWIPLLLSVANTSLCKNQASKHPWNVTSNIFHVSIIDYYWNPDQSIIVHSERFLLFLKCEHKTGKSNNLMILSHTLVLLINDIKPKIDSPKELIHHLILWYTCIILNVFSSIEWETSYIKIKLENGSLNVTCLSILLTGNGRCWSATHQCKPVFFIYSKCYLRVKFIHFA